MWSRECSEKRSELSTVFAFVDLRRWKIPRWFTPVAEIDLAGHPTLATAYVNFAIELVSVPNIKLGNPVCGIFRRWSAARKYVACLLRSVRKNNLGD